MGPLERAQAVLDRARSRNTCAVFPGDAPSPMDSDVTVTVPRSVITSCDIEGEQPAAG